jgi:hypothetical protein
LQRVPLAGYRDSAKTLFRQAKSQEDPEVIRVSQWAEIRQMHFVEGVPKKAIARRLGVDVKTVRRVVAGGQVPRLPQRQPRGRGWIPGAIRSRAG